MYCMCTRIHMHIYSQYVPNIPNPLTLCREPMVPPSSYVHTCITQWHVTAHSRELKKRKTWHVCRTVSTHRQSSVIWKAQPPFWGLHWWGLTGWLSSSGHDSVRYGTLQLTHFPPAALVQLLHDKKNSSKFKSNGSSGATVRASCCEIVRCSTTKQSLANHYP